MSGALKLAGADKVLRCAYVASGLGATGLTVTVDVWRYRSGSWTEVVSAASATEIGDGHYYYTLTSANLQAGDLFNYTFKTSDTADQKHVMGILDIQETGLFTTIAAAVWDALTSGIATANSIGKRIVDYLTGDVYARLGAPAGASVSADIAAIKAQTDLVADIPTNAELATALDPLPTLAELQSEVAAAVLTITADTGATETAILAAVGDVPTSAELAAALDPLPTAAENAAELLSTGGLGAFAADTVGQRLADMSNADIADAILASPVPGNNASGTVGGTLGRIGRYNLEARSTVLRDDLVEVVIGDDLASALGTALEWGMTGLPDLTGYSALVMTVHINGEDGEAATPVVFSSGTVVNAGQATQTIRISATDTETAELVVGEWPFDVQVTLGGLKRTLIRGTLNALENYSE